MVKIVRVLSIDGGGIRGLIPTKILLNIEKILNKPISSLFDVMIGTSTGALIVTLLSMTDDQNTPKYSCENLIHFYLHNGPDIFHSTRSKKMMRYVWGTKYSADPLEKALKKYFHNDTLGDLLKTKNILVPAYDMAVYDDFMFKSYKQTHKALPIYKVLLAATAAPTYFPPVQISVGGKTRLLVDGSIYANHPAVCALAECQRIFPKDHQVVMLSISTGFKPESNVSPNIGEFFWADTLLKILFSTSRESTNYQMKYAIGSNFHRVGPIRLVEASSKAYDASKENMDNLIKDADQAFKNKLSVIEDFLKKTGA